MCLFCGDVVYAEEVCQFLDISKVDEVTSELYKIEYVLTPAILEDLPDEPTIYNEIATNTRRNW